MSDLKRNLDFSKYKQRSIALKILYFGWDYDGLAEQDSTENTIEHHLFGALTKTCLVKSRATCRYNRCGRTDKGVSSYGQVVNLCVRSNLIDENDPMNHGLFSPENFDEKISTRRNASELDYVEILNRVLPDHIKAVAWAPVDKEFSSRFSCKSRSYSYIFPKGDLSIESMKEAANYLIGEHDFRNMCSFDLKHGVVNHKRTILSVDIIPLQSLCESSRQENPYTFYEIIIVGQAFLYHQIRCIMTVLFLVGTKKEKPNLIQDLLDLNKCPSRPNYNRSSPMPLCLFGCEYDSMNMPLGWFYTNNSLKNLLKQLKKLWLNYKTKSFMLERTMLDLESIVSKQGDMTSSSWKDFGLECDNMCSNKYIPLLKRPRDETLEKKLENIKRKKAEML